ncbi:MAG: hypothetical protein DMD81_04515 [Candidatus Rokuibacteriota bacterium]|nr:MAG: hypothetical protein DMD81_04515 [Candidatus Rokubacteria bacterium]
MAEKPMIFAVTAGLAAATLLTGCVSRHETVVPSAAPSTIIVTQPAPRIVTYPEGRWELRGGGTTDSPYFWVWVPTGSNPPNPPPVPRVR